MSRTAVWILTAASAAFLAASGVTLGVRLAAAARGPQGTPGETACTVELDRARAEAAQLRRLVAVYREREAVYRQRLEQANAALERAGREPRRWGGWREEREGRRGWDDDD
jgi:hypothetical protein